MEAEAEVVSNLVEMEEAAEAEERLPRANACYDLLGLSHLVKRPYHPRVSVCAHYAHDSRDRRPFLEFGCPPYDDPGDDGGRHRRGPSFDPYLFPYPPCLCLSLCGSSP